MWGLRMTRTADPRPKVYLLRLGGWRMRLSGAIRRAGSWNAAIVRQPVSMSRVQICDMR